MCFPEGLLCIWRERSLAPEFVMCSTSSCATGVLGLSKNAIVVSLRYAQALSAWNILVFPRMLITVHPLADIHHSSARRHNSLDSQDNRRLPSSNCDQAEAHFSFFAQIEQTLVAIRVSCKRNSAGICKAVQERSKKAYAFKFPSFFGNTRMCLLTATAPLYPLCWTSPEHCCTPPQPSPRLLVVFEELLGLVFFEELQLLHLACSNMGRFCPYRLRQ